MARHFRRVVRLCAAALLTAIALLLIYTAGLPEPTILPRLRQASAPILTGRTLDGAPFSLSAQRNVPIIVNFWASWCAPCREELPALQTLHQAGFHVIGVNVGEPEQVAAAFAAAQGVTFPNIADADYYWLRMFRVRVLPSTIFINADGTVREVVNGGMRAHELFAKAQALGKP
ncbi:MAG: TlpA disulfide reductase family protein [Anaerolineae bacterium]|nr:TlpA family protein disulfide reductase [Anaerolineae bacterium]MDW8297707.1 TlpA disulfide reductase family protein [Anaerolineae bacterium]